VRPRRNVRTVWGVEPTMPKAQRTPPLALKIGPRSTRWRFPARLLWGVKRRCAGKIAEGETPGSGGSRVYESLDRSTGKKTSAMGATREVVGGSGMRLNAVWGRFESRGRIVMSLDLLSGRIGVYDSKMRSKPWKRRLKSLGPRRHGWTGE